MMTNDDDQARLLVAIQDLDLMIPPEQVLAACLLQFEQSRSR